MADNNTPTGNENASAVAADPGVSLPRIRLGEQGFASLKTLNGKMYEEANAHFRYPNMLKVVSEMKYSPPVSIALGAISNLMCETPVIVEPVLDETPEEKVRREYLESVLHDMDSSWQATMQSISTYKEYGHQVSEMVFRRRLKKNGSKYDDGLIGLKGLKNRPQNSIARWNFSEDGRELVSISQHLRNVENAIRFQKALDENGLIVIPREKFLLFRADPVDDNPEGVSILRSAYLAYKQLTLLTDHLMVGVAKDVAGVPFAEIPPQYMSEGASDSEKATYAAVQAMVNQAADGTLRGGVFPKMVDPETKQDLFSFSLMENKGGKAYDLPGLIALFQKMILTVLSCEDIGMGDKAGSYSKTDSNASRLVLTVAYRLSEIANTLNQELVPLLWKMNGWDTSRLPKIKFGDTSSVNLDEWSAAMQRLAATGLLEVDRQMLNTIRKTMGFAPRADNEPIDKDNLTTTLAGKSSSSGKGMEVGTNGDGTAKNPGGADKNVANKENK